MWEDIKEILLDLLKSFRWYLLIIPFLIIMYIWSRFNPAAGVLPIFLILLLVPFAPCILVLGSILSFLFDTGGERECKKHKRKKEEKQRRKQNRK